MRLVVVIVALLGVIGVIGLHQDLATGADLDPSSVAAAGAAPIALRGALDSTPTHRSRRPGYDLRPTVWAQPAETCDQCVPVPTRTGANLSVVVPSPRLPAPFQPQAHRVPPVVTAAV